MRTLLLFFTVLLLAALTSPVRADAPDDPAPLGARTPRYPLKMARGLFTDAEISTAHANIAHYPAARKVADGIIKKASIWLDWSDEALSLLVTPANVPRAFDVSAGGGCPHCGKEIYKFGTYPWKVDLKKPFKLTCPVDGTVYPSNDYEAFYKSGFHDKRSWDTAYVDDGWGWTSSQGEKFWWVAHYNHQVWKQSLGPGVQNLGRAYLLTGDKRYAHKAAVLLHRMAQVYPRMEHEKQSRYGTMEAARGQRYSGKVLNHIWETKLVKQMAESYDAIWETLDSNRELQRMSGKSGPQLRSYIEANLLEDAIDAYFSGRVRGNFGMHQSALVHLMLARQFGERDKWLDDLMNRTGNPLGVTGLNFALYNLVSRDGVPYETAPGYNFGWVGNLSEMAGLLQKSNLDLFQLPRMARLYGAPLDLVNIGRFTPDLGDSGNIYGGLVGQSADVYQTAYRIYGDERYARFLARFKATGDSGFGSFNSLFLPPVTAATDTLPPQRARLLDGYGMGILNNREDSVSASLYYGYNGGHGHADRLHFQLFAAKQSLLPDLGYPDAANVYEAGRFTWSRNTIAHNTVTVDAAQQSKNVPGTVHLFADSPFARVLDVDANGTYPQCSLYRRNLMMVDAGENRSYYLDIFDIAGGAQHDYSLHGPPGTFETLGGGKWGAPALGTLAGENVALGDIYDDPKLRQKGKTTDFSGYKGSGFQHLFNVQRLQSGSDWMAQWTHEKNPQAQLRVRVLAQPGQEIILADARVSPLKPVEVKYLIARRQAADGAKNLSSRFVSVIEPFEKEAFLASAQIWPLDGGDGLAVAVRRSDGQTDVVVRDASGSAKTLRRYGLATDAQSAVVTLNGAGRATRVFFAGGTYLEADGRRHTTPRWPSGAVTAIDPATLSIRIRLKDPQATFDAASLRGRIVHFENEMRRTAHPIVAAQRQGDELRLTTRDDLLVGRVRLTGVEARQLKTNTPLILAPTYRGALVTDAQHRASFRLRAVEEGALQLAQPLPANHPFKIGQDVWLANVGSGDRLDVPPIYSWSQ